MGGVHEEEGGEDLTARKPPAGKKEAPAGKKKVAPAAKSKTEEPDPKIGRPSKMTEETKDKLEAALIGCCTEADACAYAEIDVSTYDKWKAQAKKDQDAGKVTDYVLFFRDIARAKAKAKPRLIMLLAKAAERDPRTTLAILERRYPDEWRITEKLDASINHTGGAIVVFRHIPASYKRK